MRNNIDSTSLRSVFRRGAFLVLGLMSIIGQGHAQEKNYVLKHEEVFGTLQRPLVLFPHERHMELTEDKGCGVCHHLYDEEKRTLYYEQGEESPCSDCHGTRQRGAALPLIWAYHGTCTRCHRMLAKGGKESGPTMCGECHRRH